MRRGLMMAMATAMTLSMGCARARAPALARHTVVAAPIVTPPAAPSAEKRSHLPRTALLHGR